MTALRSEWGGIRRWQERVTSAGRKLRAAPAPVRILAIAVIAFLGFFAINLFYHVLRKPTEIFAFVSANFNKAPAETWRQYGRLFREYSTAAMSPELLAALAQVEGAGNPVARTYWRWQLSWNPFSTLPASLERCRHVPDDRRSLCRGTTVLHPQSHRLTRCLPLGLALYSSATEPRDRARGGLSGPQSRKDFCGPRNREAECGAQRGTGLDDSPVRRGCSQGLRAARVPTRHGRALRGARRRELPRPSQSDGTRVPASRRNSIKRRPVVIQHAV